MEDQRPMVTITADEYFKMRLDAENSRLLNNEILSLRERQSNLERMVCVLENKQRSCT